MNSAERQRSLRESRKRVASMRGPLLCPEVVSPEVPACLGSVWLFFVDLVDSFGGLVDGWLLSKSGEALLPEKPVSLAEGPQIPPPEREGIYKGASRMPLCSSAFPVGHFQNIGGSPSDCATLRKAEQRPGVIYPEPRPPLLSDRLQCAMCGTKTRSWKVAQNNEHRECICTSCWPEYQRVRHGRKISPAVATSGDAAQSLHGTSKRRYFLKPVIL